ncbi:hypothetical protein IV203_001477 [Nitzschia inconspicua]|uniref:Pan3 C-terminal knob domain-containing protein n=1 Tax=Nitzschia inconspicua TaxID=303405 RepID=A0A9K3L9G5_9STRA|nr:hypothetical protein IV203_001477 [Nitzschia inconspicua]
MEHLSTDFGNLGFSSSRGGGGNGSNTGEWPRQQPVPPPQSRNTPPPQSHYFQRTSSRGSSSSNNMGSSVNRSNGSQDWQQLESDLNAATAKEFVPGHGWSSHQHSSASSVGSNSQGGRSYSDFFGQDHSRDQQQQQQQQRQGQDEPAPERTFSTTIPSGPTPPSFRSLHSLGLSDDTWRYYRGLSMEMNRQMDPSDPRHKAIPFPYCNGFCLDPPNPHNARSSFGYPCNTFQVVNREDGKLYCLRRFDNVKSVNPKIAATVMEQWAGLEHPGIATLHQCFVAQRAVFFVHRYIPGVQSMMQLTNPPSFDETVIWSAICQMVAVIRFVHGAGLALRTLDLRHTLVQMDSLRLRVYLNCLGVVDALEFESRKSFQQLQAEDMRNFGRWVLSMVTGTNITAVTDAQTLQNCERYCMQNYSRELRHFILTLIRSQNPPSIMDVSRTLSARLLDDLDGTQLALQRTERALAGEYESGRALRLLLKMGFVNERPENGVNRRWSQSGDCYVLTLFRDYVFHQADGAGNPVMDLGHVVTALNKVDTSDEEKIVLSSRDGKSMMVVSYADVARSLESAYHELVNGSVPPPSVQQQHGQGQLY